MKVEMPLTIASDTDDDEKSEEGDFDGLSDGSVGGDGFV